jgi:hypothetical protein
MRWFQLQIFDLRIEIYKMLWTRTSNVVGCKSLMTFIYDPSLMSNSPLNTHYQLIICLAYMRWFQLKIFNLRIEIYKMLWTRTSNVVGCKSLMTFIYDPSLMSNSPLNIHYQLIICLAYMRWFQLQIFDLRIEIYNMLWTRTSNVVGCKSLMTFIYDPSLMSNSPLDTHYQLIICFSKKFIFIYREFYFKVYIPCIHSY